MGIESEPSRRDFLKVGAKTLAGVAAVGTIGVGAADAAKLIDGTDVSLGRTEVYSGGILSSVESYDKRWKESGITPEEFANDFVRWIDNTMRTHSLYVQQGKAINDGKISTAQISFEPSDFKGYPALEKTLGRMDVFMRGDSGSDIEVKWEMFDLKNERIWGSRHFDSFRESKFLTPAPKGKKR